MRNTTRRLTAALLGTLALGTVVPTLAQTTRTLDEVVVTANKFPQKQSQTGKVITVVPDSVLQRYATQTVGELLARQAGIMLVGAQGPLGTNPDLYTRGAGAGNTLILLDGIPVYDPSGTANAFDLNLITVGECERIEILKGAQSTAYGSDAVAGVIAISTRKAGKRPLGGTATAQYGSYRTFRGTAGLNGATERVSYNLQYTRLSSAGFSAATDRDNTGTFDKDGFRQNALLGSIAITLTPHLTLKLRGLSTTYTTDIDAGAFADEKDFVIKNRFNLAATGLEWTHQRGKLTVNYALTDSRRQFTDDSAQVEKGAFNKYSYQAYGGLTHFADVYHTLKIRDNIEILTGADYRFANTDQSYFSVDTQGQPFQSPSLGADTARTGQGSVYASGVFRVGNRLFLELGGRYNYHSIYGNAVTYSFNPSYLIANRVKVFANLSSGFRAPTLYQLFSIYGNKDLKPERSQSVEVGVQVFTKAKNAWVRALYFNRHIRDAIFFRSLSTPPYTSQYINFDDQYAQGVELEAQAQLKNLTLTGNLTLLGGRTVTQANERDTTYNTLFRQPKTMLNLSAGYQFTTRLFGSVALRSIGERVDRFFNDQTFTVDDVPLAAYTTVDLYADYRIRQSIRLYGDIRNLFDQTYTDIYGYNTRRRNGNVGVRVSF
ncbi:MAG: TonB-dependent receptor [Bacteroidetes bacterium]|nr:TonB-dependent receptor [Fibrella sp.]